MSFKALELDQYHARRHRLLPPPPPETLSCAALRLLWRRRFLSLRLVSGYRTAYNTSTCGVLSSIIACVQWHNSRPRPPLTGTAVGDGSPSRSGSSGGGSVGAKGRKSVVILPRDAHKSAVHALVLSGATPCFLPPIRHPKSGLSLGVSTAAIEAALEEHGDEVGEAGAGCW